MTFLSFAVAGRRFALPAADVLAVVPFAPLRPIDGTPAWVAGLLPFFDRLVPVIDICELQAHRPCRRAYATRIIVARYLTGASDVQPLGLLAEHVTDVVDVDETAWRSPGIDTPETPWLGALANAGGTWVQRVTVTELLTEDVRARLFPQSHGIDA